MIKNEEEFKKLTTDYNFFNSYMIDREEKIKQQLLLSLPAIIFKFIKNNQEYEKELNTFYTSNPSLVGNKNIIQQVVKEVAAQNPGMELKEVLELSIPRIKERIKGVLGE